MFKDNLKKLREEANLTQEELAEKLFVSRSAVAKWEQGRGIPRNDTIEEIAKVFNVTINTFYKQDEPQKVIENLERFNKRNIILSFLGSLLVVIIFIVIVFIVSRNTGEKIEYDVFYSDKTLEGYGLVDLKPVTQNSIGSVNWNDNYYVSIDGYETFEEYVNYLFEYLQNSPYISYVGFLVERPLKESTYMDRKNYILKSDNLEDYLTSIYYNDKENNPVHYTFYYLPVLKNKHQEKDPIDFHFIGVEYQKEISSWIKIGDIEYKSNFHMSIHSTTNYGPLGDFYLFHEHFELKKIEINQENFYDYFYVDCNTHNPGYSWYTIRYIDKFYFRAYLPLTLEVGKDEDYESKDTIVYSPRDGNEIKLKKAYGYIDPVDNKLKYRSNVIVEDGYIYSAIPK